MSATPRQAAVAAAEEILATLQAGEPHGESLANHPVKEIAAIIARATDRAGWQAPKIVQLLLTPNDNTWQGTLLGLADDGGTYCVGPSGAWEPYIAPLDHRTSLPAPPSAPSLTKV